MNEPYTMLHIHKKLDDRQIRRGIIVRCFGLLFAQLFTTNEFAARPFRFAITDVALGSYFSVHGFIHNHGTISICDADCKILAFNISVLDIFRTRNEILFPYFGTIRRHSSIITAYDLVKREALQIIKLLAFRTHQN